MIEPGHPGLSVSRQCALLSISRSSFYYLPMRRGFLYLVAIMDWFTRTVLAWRISNTLEAGAGPL